MKLFELFDARSSDIDDGNDLRQSLKNDAMDILMPFAAHGVPFVTVQNIIDKLGEQKSGLAIDRALVMDILDPDQVKIIKKIEGDKIFLNVPEAEGQEREVTQQQQIKDKQKTVNTAQQQAKKQVTAPATAPAQPPPPPAPGPTLQ